MLFLCGLPGSGKSTLGKRLANRLKFSFIDLDQLIFQQTAILPADWIKHHGETRFREVEASTLRSLAGLDKHIVSCGGGTPCFHDNITWMKQHGVTLFINPPLKMIVNRLQNSIQERPLLNKDHPETALEELWQKRASCYKQLDYALDPTKLSIDELAERVAIWLG